MSIERYVLSKYKISFRRSPIHHLPEVIYGIFLNESDARSHAIAVLNKHNIKRYSVPISTDIISVEWIMNFPDKKIGLYHDRQLIHFMHGIEEGHVVINPALAKYVTKPTASVKHLVDGFRSGLL